MAYYDAALAAIEADAAGGSNELRVACELNKARAFLKLQDEGACLAACERAEEIEPQSQAPFVRAQLFWLLSGGSMTHNERAKVQQPRSPGPAHALSIGASDQWEGLAVPRAERKARLTEAKAILREMSGEGGDRSKAVLILLRSVQDALKT